jgi:hypothetical protein
MDRDSITRKQFLGRLAGGTVVVLLDGCGGGDDYGGMAPAPSPGPAPPPAACAAAGITANHGHTLSFQKTDLDSMTDKTYSIAGSAGHVHTITLNTTQLAQLKAGSMVTVTSTVTDAHSHDVTVSCS